MAYWKHPTQRSGLMSFGRRRYAQIRSDGVFEAPKEDAVSARLAAAGCIPLAEAPTLAPVKGPERGKTAKQLRLEARRERRAREGKEDPAPSVETPVRLRHPSGEEIDVSTTASGSLEVQTVITDEVSRLQALAEANDVETNATSEQGLKAALTKAGIDWKQGE